VTTEGSSCHSKEGVELLRWRRSPGDLDLRHPDLGSRDVWMMLVSWAQRMSLWSSNPHLLRYVQRWVFKGVTMRLVLQVFGKWQTRCNSSYWRKIAIARVMLTRIGAKQE
jgi:hypothetical protein